MKRLLNILVLLLLSFLAHSQIYVKPNNTYGLRINRIWPEHSLTLPSICGTPTKADLNSNLDSLPAIMYDTCGHKLYVYDPTDTTWHVAGTGSGSASSDSLKGQPVDTTSNGQYFLLVHDSINHQWILRSPDSLPLSAATITALASKADTSTTNALLDSVNNRLSRVDLTTSYTTGNDGINIINSAGSSVLINVADSVHPGLVTPDEKILLHQNNYLSNGESGIYPDSTARKDTDSSWMFKQIHIGPADSTATVDTTHADESITWHIKVNQDKIHIPFANINNFSDTLAKFLRVADSTAGYITHYDGDTSRNNIYAALAGKQSSLTFGNLSGTTNQVNLSGSGTGSIIGSNLTLSLPQNIHTGATPQFLRLGLGAAASSSTALLLPASTTSISSGRIPNGVRPTSPVSGDFYQDGTHLYIYMGTTWDTLDLQGAGGTGITSLNGLTGGTQTFATGTSGTDFNIVSTGTTHTFNFPNSDGTHRGLLASTDWTTFNNKGDASTNTSTSVDGEIALFSGTAGKTLKRATGTGYVKSASGVFSTSSTIPASDVTGLPTTGAIDTTYVGNVYSENSWTDLSAFAVNNTTATVSSGKISIGSGATDFSKSLELGDTTCVNHTWFGIKFAVPADGLSNYGPSLAYQSINDSSMNGVDVFLNTSTDGNRGKMEFFTQEQAKVVVGSWFTQWRMSQALSMTAGDSVIFSMQRSNNTLTFRALNKTTNQMVDTTFTIGYQSSIIMPNTARPAIYCHGGTFGIDSIGFSLQEIKNPDIMYVGDSKTWGYGASSFLRTWPALLGRVYHSVVISGGFADRTNEVINRLTEIKKVNPKYVVLGIGSNDLRFGNTEGTFEANYDTIVARLEAAGINVIHLSHAYESNQNLTTQNNFLETQSPLINIWDVTHQAGALYGDGIHLTDKGDSLVYRQILASNLLPNPKNTFDFLPASSGGTLTNFSSGNLSPLFITSVSNSSTTPSQSFSLTNASAHKFFGNFTGSTGAPSYSSPSLASADFANQGTTTTLLHGNAAGNPSWSAVSLTADVTGILPAANGGTGNGFTTFSGPATSTKTFTLPNASATILTTNAVVTVSQGGTGAATLTGYVKGNGTSAFTASSTIPGSDVSGNISGNAANVTGTVAIANGGTGQTTANAGLNALLPSQTGNTGKVLQTNGTNSSWVDPTSFSPVTTGTYTPTYIDSANANSSLGAVAKFRYVKTDSIVTIYGKWYTAPSAASGAEVYLLFSLPPTLSANFTNSNDVFGPISAVQSVGSVPTTQPIRIEANTDRNMIGVSIKPTSTTDGIDIEFSCTYIYTAG